MKIKRIPAKAISYGGTRRLSDIFYIVIHYTSNKGDTAENNGLYFKNVNKIKAGAHFFIDQKGNIVQSINLNRVAWAVGGSRYSDWKKTGGGNFYGLCTNRNSVSIELCDNATKDPSQAQIEATKATIAYIQSKCKNAKLIIRHFDVTGKSCLPIEDTELLTLNGWVYLRDIRKGDIVCEYDINSDSCRFAPVLDVVKPHIDEVLENRNIIATANHRMYVKPSCVNSKKYREILFGNILIGQTQYTIKNGASIESAGLPLSDDEIRLLVWIQGDGHYMICRDKITGIEFHLKKERKINRICDILDEMEIEYRISACENGSQHIRIYDKSYVDWAEKWLCEKQFTYKFIEMDDRQFEIFKTELIQVDGCESGNKQMYTSIIPQNLDVVQAICATHGLRSNQQNLGADYRCAVTFHDSNYTFGGKNETKRRKAIVSCVTVPSGYILIRQNFKTFIVGNCPARMTNINVWNRFKKRIKP